MGEGARSKCHSFLESIQDEISDKTLLLAVSGGSDSVALLALLHSFLGEFRYALRVITVDHRLRAASESSGDARFVEALCAGLNPPVPCVIADLGDGSVLAEAKRRGRGIEEAARFLRYAALSREAEKVGAACAMTAHTRDDLAETILMRFFQGSSGGPLSGIRSRRGIFVRPLLDCSREELREFLRTAHVAWREDSTNASDAYLRNRIRLRIVPQLQKYLPGWLTGIRHGAERAAIDEDFIRSFPVVPWTEIGERLELPGSSWFALHPAVRLRLLTDGLRSLSRLFVASGRVFPRVSGAYLLTLARLSREQASRGHRSNGLAFGVSGDAVFWEADIVHNDKSGYLVCVSRAGTYELPIGAVRVTQEPDGAYVDGKLGPFQLPVIVRSRVLGDWVRARDGGKKTLKKLMNDWSIPTETRDRIPLVEREGAILAVYGSYFGYKDWLVRK